MPTTAVQQDDAVFAEALASAEALYDRYVELARLTELAAPGAEEVLDEVADPNGGTPMGLVTWGF